MTDIWNLINALREKLSSRFGSVSQRKDQVLLLATQMKPSNLQVFAILGHLGIIVILCLQISNVDDVINIYPLVHRYASLNLGLRSWDNILV